jgi:hypothetical protein
LQVSATITDARRSVKASFFFDPTKCPKAPVAGDKVRLIGTQLQQWRGQLQLCGKNIQFGDPVICVSLPDAISAWGVVSAQGAQLYFPKLSIVVSVTTWSKSDTSKGTQRHTQFCYA